MPSTVRELSSVRRASSSSPSSFSILFIISMAGADFKLWVSRSPRRSLANLPGCPARIILRKPLLAASTSVNPRKFPISTTCSWGSLKFLRHALSPRLPGTRTVVSWPSALATSRQAVMESFSASWDMGLTMPVVPIMEMPPRMPSLGLKVFLASSSPPGTEMVIFSPLHFFRSGTAADCIMSLGTGLMAA